MDWKRWQVLTPNKVNFYNFRHQLTRIREINVTNYFHYTTYKSKASYKWNLSNGTATMFIISKTLHHLRIV